MLYNKICFAILSIALSFTAIASENVFDLSCGNIQAESATASQKTVMRTYCENLQWLLNKNVQEQDTCTADINHQVNDGPYGIVNLSYDVEYQCSDNVLEVQQSFVAAWFTDGRSISAAAIWASLDSAQKKSILDELIQDQEEGSLCPDPVQPSLVEIQDYVITFSNFYPKMTNPLQRQACDVPIIRPPFLAEAYLMLETETACLLPPNLLEKIESLRWLAPYFNQNPDEQTAQRVWQVFPKNYFELVATLGSWWFPGWDNVFFEENLSLRSLQESESSALSICNGSLSQFPHTQILPAWYKLYNYIPKEEWVSTNIRFQSGLWQLSGVEAFADFNPEALGKDWSSEAAINAWKNVTVEDLTGLYFWVNSDPNRSKECDEQTLRCEIIDPIDPEHVGISGVELTDLKRKLSAAKAEYLK